LAPLIEKELPYPGILRDGVANKANRRQTNHREKGTPHQTVLASKMQFEEAQRTMAAEYDRDVKRRRHTTLADGAETRL
jgi:hypothetical protein